MVDYGLIMGVAVPLFGVIAADRIAEVMKRRLPSKHKNGAKMVSLLSMFICVAYGIADTAIAIHESGAPSIFFVLPLAGLGYMYWRHFKTNLRSLRAKVWRIWYSYVFVIGCFVIATISYFLLAFSILELQYNVL